MKNTVDVEFGDRDETLDGDDQISLKITFHTGIDVHCTFQVENGQIFTAQEYRDFGSGKVNNLTFNDSNDSNDSNGYIGIDRKGYKIVFEINTMMSECSFMIPNHMIQQTFELIATEREKLEVKS